MARQSLAAAGKLALIFSSASLAVSWKRFSADIRIPRPPYTGRLVVFKSYKCLFGVAKVLSIKRLLKPLME
jgi:hypothetical protein